MARIAGINIPVNKHVVIALTHIHGIGRSRGARACKAAESRADDTGQGSDASPRSPSFAT